MLLRQGSSSLYVSGTQSLEEGRATVEVPLSVNWKELHGDAICSLLLQQKQPFSSNKKMCCCIALSLYAV